MKHHRGDRIGAVDTHGMVGRALRTICSVHFTAIFVIDLLSHRCDKRVVGRHVDGYCAYSFQDLTIVWAGQGRKVLRELKEETDGL